jgi:hypothetical protein
LRRLRGFGIRTERMEARMSHDYKAQKAETFDSFEAFA